MNVVFIQIIRTIYQQNTGLSIEHIWSKSKQIIWASKRISIPCAHKEKGWKKGHSIVIFICPNRLILLVLCCEDNWNWFLTNFSISTKLSKVLCCLFFFSMFPLLFVNCLLLFMNMDYTFILNYFPSNCYIQPIDSESTDRGEIQGRTN